MTRDFIQFAQPLEFHIYSCIRSVDIHLMWKVCVGGQYTGQEKTILRLFLLFHFKLFEYCLGDT